MKAFLYSVSIVILCLTIMAQTSETTTPAPGKLRSTIFEWQKMQPAPTANGVRRAVFDGPTATVDKLHCHVTTLNPGANSGEPRRHLQDEVIIIKEGTVEATVDGRNETAGPGSVIFFAADAVTRLRNIGDEPATYTVVYYYTPLTPKK
jgi:XRE family transcriptional regulator, regulator of sulfur utilization